MRGEHQRNRLGLKVGGFRQELVAVAPQQIKVDPPRLDRPEAAIAGRRFEIAVIVLFLVDDTNPIEAGRLPDGSPDLYFRGFYCWNSEVGSKTLGIASFYLRAVCQNPNLWGVEDFEEITIRHSKYAASRFAHEAAPALTRARRPSSMGSR